MVSGQARQFAHEIADMFDAENQFLQAHRVMLPSGTDPVLIAVIEEHIVETEDQIERLEEVFAEVGNEPERESCAATKGLIDECKRAIGQARTEVLRDSFIVRAALKAAYYKMVGYVDLIEDAETLRLERAVQLLTQNREQEVRTANRLERMSERLSVRAA
jgi:ferritin-like metal-binding protein YciE